MENSGKNWRMAMKRKKLQKGEDGGQGERGNVHVGNAAELLEEVAGEKRDDGVL